MNYNHTVIKYKEGAQVLSLQREMRQITPQQMKEYLWHAMQFEKYVYIWTKAMDAVNTQMKGIYTERDRMKQQLNRIAGEREKIEGKFAKKSDGDQKRIKELEERIQICKKRRPKFLALAILFGALGVAALVLLVCTVLNGAALIDEGLSGALILADFCMPLFVVCLIPTAIFTIRYLVDGKKIKGAIKRIPELQSRTYDDKANEAQAQLDPQVDKINYQLRKLDQQEEALTDHQERVFLELQNAKKVRSNIYALGFLHEDYHDFVAVSTMYGYLDRGRCTTLMGSGGIYDTFEKDLQMQTVIRNLQDLNASMDRVEANQRVLINEMRAANQHLASMSRSLNNIEDYSRQTAQNTAMTAVASQQAAAELKWQSYQMWANS